MNGDSEFVIDDVNEFISKVDNRINIPYIVSNDDVKFALSMTKDKLESLNLEDYGYYVYQLTLYSLHIQREYNRVNTIKIWAENKLNKMIAKEIDQYKDSYLKFDIKVKKIIENDTAAQRFDNMIMKSNVLLSELEYISSKISSIAEVINDYKKTKERINAKL